MKMHSEFPTSIYLVDPSFGSGRAEKSFCHSVLLAAPIFRGDEDDSDVDESMDLPWDFGQSVWDSPKICY